MKRLARYLLEVPDPKIRYDSDERKLDTILVYVDSDWAGCKSTRNPQAVALSLGEEGS